MRIYYGSAFNPPTRAHMEIIRRLSSNPNDQLYVGLADHPYKEFAYDGRQRREMLLAAMRCQGLARRGNVELVMQDERTWKFLSFSIPEKEMEAIALGEDEWNDLLAGKWQYSNLILEKYHCIVVPRRNGISSSTIREWIANGRKYDAEIGQFIDEPVYELAARYYRKGGNNE